MTKHKKMLVGTGAAAIISLGLSTAPLADPINNTPNNKNVPGVKDNRSVDMESRRLVRTDDVDTLATKLNQWIGGKKVKPSEAVSLRDTAQRVISILDGTKKSDPLARRVKTMFAGKLNAMNAFLLHLKLAATPAKDRETGGAKKLTAGDDIKRYVIPSIVTTPLNYTTKGYRRGLFFGDISLSAEAKEAFGGEANGKKFISKALTHHLGGGITAEDAKALGVMAETSMNHDSSWYKTFKDSGVLDRLKNGDTSAIKDLFENEKIRGIVGGLLSPDSQLLVLRKFPFDYKEMSAELNVELIGPAGRRKFQNVIDNVVGAESKRGVGLPVWFLGADVAFKAATIRAFSELETLTPGAIKLSPTILEGTGYNLEGNLALNFGGHVFSRAWILKGEIGGGYNSVEFKLPDELVADQSKVYLAGRDELEKIKGPVTFDGAYMGLQRITLSNLGKPGETLHSLRIDNAAGHMGGDFRGNYLLEASVSQKLPGRRWNLDLKGDARLFFAMRAMEEEVQRAVLGGVSGNAAIDFRLLKNNRNWKLGALLGCSYDYFTGFGEAGATHMVTLSPGLRASWKGLGFSANYGRTFNSGQITKDINSFMLNLFISPIEGLR
jgi:hypothetical protein